MSEQERAESQEAGSASRLPGRAERHSAMRETAVRTTSDSKKFDTAAKLPDTARPHKRREPSQNTRAVVVSRVDETGSEDLASEVGNPRHLLDKGKSIAEATIE